MMSFALKHPEVLEEVFKRLHEVKVKAMTDLPPPTTVKEVRRV